MNLLSSATNFKARQFALASSLKIELADGSIIFRICSEFSVLFRICSAFSVMFSNVQTVQNI
jgi:hypothetical protein